MKALKCLAAGAIGPFSGYEWPLPDAGTWVEAEAVPCESGIHACLPEHLPHWLHDELWEIELDGAIVESGTKLVAERGRLLARVEAWDAAGPEFGSACLARLRELATRDPRVEGYAQDGATHQELGLPAVVGFIAARAAEVAGGPAAYDAERAWQAAWLADRLGLTPTP